MQSKDCMLRLLDAVDATGAYLGQITKRRCHLRSKLHPDGILHRAFSLIEIDPESNLILMQRRSKSKRSFPGLWTNSVCSHFTVQQDPLQTIKERYQAEWGAELLYQPRIIGRIVYKASSKDTVENEVDHVYTVPLDSRERRNYDLREIGDFKVDKLGRILDDVKNRPDKYTPWFRLILESGLLGNR
jgi:isopentenyl-diphosphate delta-isomerase